MHNWCVSLLPLLLVLGCCVRPAVGYPPNGPCDVSFDSLSQLQAAGYIPTGFQPFSLSVVSSAPLGPSSVSSSAASPAPSAPTAAVSSSSASSATAAASSSTSHATSSSSSAFSSTSPPAVNASAYSSSSSSSAAVSSGPSSSNIAKPNDTAASTAAASYSSSASAGPTGPMSGSSSSGTSSPSSPGSAAAVSSYADYGAYTVLLSVNQSLIAAYLPVSGWLIYATSVDYLPGSLTLNLSSAAWQPLSAANSQCTAMGVVDANSGLTANYSTPLSVQWAAPSHLSGNVTFNALVLVQNTYFFTVPALSVSPSVPAPVVTAPVSYVGCNASTDGVGGMTFVCWFSGNDGGAFVSYIGVYAYSSADSATPIDGYRTATAPVGSYPTYATFHFALTVGQTYFFQLYAGNSVGAGPANSTTLTDLSQSQSTPLPVSASSTSISAGGVFGIVVGCLAAVGLIVLAGRFYTRKGHLRQHMKHIDTSEPADDEQQDEDDQDAAEDDVQLDDGDDDDEAGVDEADEGSEDDLELGAEEHEQKHAAR